MRLLRASCDTPPLRRTFAGVGDSVAHTPYRLTAYVPNGCFGRPSSRRCGGVSAPAATAAPRFSFASQVVCLRLSRRFFSTAAPASVAERLHEIAHAAVMEPEVCVLCDKSFTSWKEHRCENAHVARRAVCGFFVMPEKSESIMQHIERHIALDLNEVDALALRKVERRRRRLLSGLMHLVEEGVLWDCLPALEVSPSRGAGAVPATDTNFSRVVTSASLSVKQDKFLNRVLLGEAFMRRELLDRSARLMPSLSAVELQSVTAYLTSSRQLARTFDELSLMELLKTFAEARRPTPTSDTAQPSSPSDAALFTTGAAKMQGDDSTVATVPSSQQSGASTESDARATSSPPLTPPLPPPGARWALSRENKASIVLACVGELHRFHEQERPRFVASKSAADDIVLHVLAGHARENIVSELLHEALQRIVDEGTAVWREFERFEERQGSSCPPGENLGDGAPSNPHGGAKSRQDPPLYVRWAPLPREPSAAPASSVTVLDAATAERLLSAYLPLRDGEGERPFHESEGDLVDPVVVSSLLAADEKWEPLVTGLRGRWKTWNCCSPVPTVPLRTEGKQSEASSERGEEKKERRQRRDGPIST